LFFSSPNSAWADTKVYISISVGGGALIGMVGYYFHVTYSSRIAQKKEEEQQGKDLNKKLALKTSFSSSPKKSLPHFHSLNQEVPPSNRLELNLFTYTW
jgi:hypothetical protein